MTEDTETVAVVGGGPGGYTAAIRAAQHGLDVTLVERDALGGVCLNHGCIPSKALVTATDVAQDAREAASMGVHADPSVDVAEMAAWKDGVVDRLTGGVEKLCKANGVTLREGTASFADASTLRVSEGDSEAGGDADADANAETLPFDAAILATGSRPVEIPGFPFDTERVLDSRAALGLEAAPDSVVVVGAGYVGMELSTVWAKLGVDVTVVEALDAVLPRYPADLVRPVRRRAEDLGVEFHLEHAAAECHETGEGVLVRTEGPEGDVAEFAGEVALVAVGREPVTDSLDLSAAGVETDERGYVVTDEQCRTSAEGVYAVGDVAGEPLLAHAASAEGKVAAADAAGADATMADRAVPAAVFTDPEIATVGLTETAAEERGHAVAVGEFPFRASGRALTREETAGFVRVVADADAGTVLGGQVVGPEAAELIAEVALAVETGATLEDVAATVHTHPTLSEAVLEAAENAVGRAVNTLNR